MEPERVADYGCHTGEGPLWHPDEERLYWVDIPDGELYRYDPATNEHDLYFDSEEAIGGYTIQADGSLLLFGEGGSVRVLADGEVVDTLIAGIEHEADSRFNDVIADPEGRVFCGTMPPDGALYRLDRDGSLTELMDDVEVSNGMGFTPDGEGLYYCETGKDVVWLFDYDRDTGGVSNKRVFADTADGPGHPDGMTVDEEGYVWSARWDGHCLVRHDPDDGEPVETVEFPVPKVSCLTFGGPDYGDAYVTTAGGHEKESEGEHAGALFRVDLGVGGVPEFRSQIGL